MRIGILTLPLYTNYGGILQAYALQTVLERMGHEVIEIETKYKYNPIRLPYHKIPFVIAKRLVKKYILGQSSLCVFSEKKYNETVLPNLWKITQYTDEFISKHIHRVLLDTYCDVDKFHLDAIIVGSDQVWRPKYIRNKIYDAYLDFAKSWKIRRISYAVSFGVDEWEYDEDMTKKCSDLSTLFDSISVRESGAIELCKTYLKRNDVIQVVDPTLLLEKDDYIKLFINNTSRNNGNLMVYILDRCEEFDRKISCFAKKNNFVPFWTNSFVENGKSDITERIQPPLEPWLRGFYDAELVLTDSFHACVFSIIFRKPFFVISNKERGNARILSLLQALRLENRIIDDSLSIENIREMIDYDKVYRDLKEMKEFSLDYLRNSLV